jgi:hypothetical protein
MKNLQTRGQKLKFLQDLHTGKVVLRNILMPGYGVLFVRGGKVYAHQDVDGYKALDAEIDAEVYMAQRLGTFSHIVELVDFSKPIENNNKQQ